MNTIQIFNYQDAQVRTIMKDGEPWFVAKDVAETLGYVWNGTARISHVPAEWRGVTSVVTPSGMQDMSILSEQGLYFFLSRSDKPKAIPLQKWVAGEVLPSIRKTGSYSLQLPTTFSEALRMLADSVDREEENRPKVEAFDAFLGTKNAKTMNEVAKALDIGRNTLFRMLRDKQILMYGNNLPFQRYIEAGYFTVREVTIKAGEESISQTLVTAKGVEFIRKALLTVCGGVHELN